MSAIENGRLHSEDWTQELETVFASPSLKGEERIKAIVALTRSGDIFTRDRVQEAKTILEKAAQGGYIDSHTLLYARVRNDIYENLLPEQRKRVSNGGAIIMDAYGNRSNYP